MNWSDEQVTAGMKRVVASERENLVLFLRYLIEMEKRELFLLEGASSIEDYLERFLGLSHGTARKRVWVARAALQFPVILEYLESGKLNLTSVSWLIKHLSSENHLFLLSEAQGKSEAELRWWLSTLFPESLPLGWQRTGKEKIIPLDGECAKFILVVDKSFIEKLSRSKEIHKHQVPDGNALELLKNALDEDLKRNDPKEKRLRVSKRQLGSDGILPTPQSKTASRRIPSHIAHSVRERDHDQCSYVSPRGIRCSQKAGLELDHVFNWAWGGSSNDIDNIRLYCQPHNRYKARRDFKKDFRKRTHSIPCRV